MPALAVANCISTHCETLVAQMPTRSPRANPRAISPRAVRSTSACNCAPGEAQLLLAQDERGRVRIAGRHLVQHLADAEIDQRRMVRASRVAGGLIGVARPSLAKSASSRQTPFRCKCPARGFLVIVNGKIIHGDLYCAEFLEYSFRAAAEADGGSWNGVDCARRTQLAYVRKWRLRLSRG